MQAHPAMLPKHDSRRQDGSGWLGLCERGRRRAGPPDTVAGMVPAGRGSGISLVAVSRRLFRRLGLLVLLAAAVQVVLRALRSSAPSDRAPTSATRARATDLRCVLHPRRGPRHPPRPPAPTRWSPTRRPAPADAEAPAGTASAGKAAAKKAAPAAPAKKAPAKTTAKSTSKKAATPAKKAPAKKAPAKKSPAQKAAKKTPAKKAEPPKPDNDS